MNFEAFAEKGLPVSGLIRRLSRILRIRSIYVIIEYKLETNSKRQPSLLMDLEIISRTHIWSLSKELFHDILSCGVANLVSIKTKVEGGALLINCFSGCASMGTSPR